MKKGLSSFVLALSFVLSGGAHAAPAQIKHLSCSSLEGTSGATSVSLVGTYGGRSYVNITNVSPVGIPFSQQAEIVQASLVENSLVLELYTVITHGRLRLALDNGSNRGQLSASVGGRAIEMTCSANVQALN